MVDLAVAMLVEKAAAIMDAPVAVSDVATVNLAIMTSAAMADEVA